MSQQLKFNNEASAKIKEGVDKLADAVKVTLGPKGRNVIIEKKGVTPHITKDGVTVANSITLEDPIENMGAQLVKDVASKTAHEAGDGTTTATVLAQAIYSAGLRHIAAGANPMDLKRGIDAAVNTIVSKIRMQAIQVTDEEQLRQVATISANGDSMIADIVVAAVTAVGPEGLVTVEDGNSLVTEVNTVLGMQFDSGYTSPRFVTHPGTATVEFEAPLYLIYDGKLAFMKQLQPVLEQVLKANRPLVIICDKIDGEALQTLVVNSINGRLKVVSIQAPYYGDRKTETMTDIATVTGSKVFSDEAGFRIEEAKLDELGVSDKIVVERTSTLIVGGVGNTDKAVEDLRTLIANSEDPEWYKLRLSRLLGGVSVIKVGAASGVEMKEIKDRIDDALQATRAAMAEGILPGGGSTLAKLGAYLGSGTSDTGLGIKIIQTACEAPIRAIATNAGVNPDTILERSMGENGWNARTNEWGNLIEMGVIDPAKVTRLALENAASVAGLLLTTQCVIYSKPE